MRGLRGPSAKGVREAGDQPRVSGRKEKKKAPQASKGKESRREIERREKRVMKTAHGDDDDDDDDDSVFDFRDGTDRAKEGCAVFPD